MLNRDSDVSVSVFFFLQLFFIFDWSRVSFFLKIQRWINHQEASIIILVGWSDVMWFHLWEKYKKHTFPSMFISLSFFFYFCNSFFFFFFSKSWGEISKKKKTQSIDGDNRSTNHKIIIITHNNNIMVISFVESWDVLQSFSLPF